MSVCIVGCACVLNCHQTVSSGRYTWEMDTDYQGRFGVRVLSPPGLLQHSLCTARVVRVCAVVVSHGSERRGTLERC